VIKLVLLGLVLSGAGLISLGQWRAQRERMRLAKLPAPWAVQFGFLPGEGMEVLGALLILVAIVFAVLGPIVFFWICVW
jgi:hypothetical protein